MIKRLLLIALGAAAALQLERTLERMRLRLSPNAVTGTLLDKLNRRLESERDPEVSG